MEPMYLEIVIQQQDLARAGVDSEALENAVEAMLRELKMGALTGGGSGSRNAIIEVELHDRTRLDEGIALLRKALLDAGAPAGTVIKQLEPDVRVFSLMG